MIIQIDMIQLKKALDILIGDDSSDYCGCYEGDITYVFSSRKIKLIESIISLLESQKI